MRLYLVAAFAAFALSAFAQDKDLISAPSPSVQSRAQLYRTFDFQENDATPTFRHQWYWEVPDFGPSWQEINRYLPRGAKIGSNDFSPASLHWNFEGKRKVVPVIDLTVMQIKPGEKANPTVSHADNAPAPFAVATLWTKATHSISSLLHY